MSQNKKKEDSPAGLARWLPFQTLRGRIMFFACFATLPAFVFVVYIATKERAAALHRVETESLYVANNASIEHSLQVTGAKRLLERLGDLQESGESQAELISLLENMLIVFPQFANLGILRPDGELEFSVVSPPRHINMSEVPAFQESLSSSEVSVGTYLIGLIVERPILILAKSLRNRKGKPKQVLFVALDLEWLDKLAKQSGLPEESSLLIVDREGAILSSSIPDSRFHSRRGVLKGFGNVLKKPSQLTLTMTPDGVRRLAVATPLGGLEGLWVVVGTPEQNVYAVINEIFLRDLAVLALLSLLAILSSLVATDLSVLKDIRSLARVTRRFGGGDLAVRARIPKPHGEIRDLTLAFNAMADGLDRQNQQAVVTQERLRALSHKLQTAKEEESARIAQELHDELGQELSMLKIELERTGRRITERVGDEDPLVVAMVELGEKVDTVIRSVRRISSELRPGVLDRLGLVEGLEWLLNQFKLRSAIHTILQVEGVRERVAPDISIALFRITQEALTNIVRHSHATEVKVFLMETDESLILAIEDNGDGFNPGECLSAPSLGLLGMRERAARLHGELDIVSAVGKGTELVVSIPKKHNREGNEPS